MMITVVYLLILAAVILLIAAAVRSRDLGQKDSRASTGKKTGRGSGSGGTIFVDPVLDHETDPKTQEKEEDNTYTFLYQYSPRRDVWICSCCEAENQAGSMQCQVCGRNRS